MKVEAKWDGAQLRAISTALQSGPYRRAVKKAGSTALRDMRSETSKRVRGKVRLKARDVKQAIKLERPRGRVPIAGMKWKLKMGDIPIPLFRYPHRQTKRGVAVTVYRGTRIVVPGTFVATMPKSGHKGIYMRKSRSRLPIRELFGSKPVDVMLGDGNALAVLKRGRDSFGRTWERVLPLEMEKER